MCGKLLPGAGKIRAFLKKIWPSLTPGIYPLAVLEASTLDSWEMNYTEFMPKDEQGQYTEITNGIRVTASPEYLPEQSDPNNNLYAFSYSITIENTSSESVQLINRHWVIFSGTRQHGDVKGEGVVGVQPIIGPSDRFEYTSGATIKDTAGAMEGTYTFVGENGDFFDVKIPRFDFIYPDLLN